MLKDTVGNIVARQPGLSRVFELMGIDYCCGGRKTLELACLENDLDPQKLVSLLENAEANDNHEDEINTTTLPLTELVDHIEQTHHAFLRSELPRLAGMTEKVANVHGDEDSRLHQVQSTFQALAEELSSHMMKEEKILFPMIRQLEASETLPEFHCGTLAHPIQQMEHEHDGAGSALERLRELTDGYSPPTGACNTYRAMLDALAHLERDMHQHIHKENNVLFPRALAMESQKNNQSLS